MTTAQAIMNLATIFMSAAAFGFALSALSRRRGPWYAYLPSQPFSDGTLFNADGTILATRLLPGNMTVEEIKGASLPTGMKVTRRTVARDPDRPYWQVTFEGVRDND